MIFSVSKVALILTIFLLVHLAKPETTSEAEKWVWNELRQQDCGTISTKLRPRRPMLLVTHGRRISLMSRPWMALLFLPNAMDFCRCGGTLITKRFVLTAAHCLVMCPRKKDLKVRLGEHTITSSQDCSMVQGQRICAPAVKEFDIEKIIVHEEFSLFSQINDIALLQLSKTVKPNIHIRPICLPLTPDLQAQTSILGKSYFATGWGATELGHLSNELLEVHIASYQCPSKFLNRSILCSNGDTQDTCKGDSGGPLLAKSSFFDSDRHVQFGVISHGSWSCGQGAGAYFTEVAPYMPWIIRKIAIYVTENPGVLLGLIEKYLFPL